MLHKLEMPVYKSQLEAILDFQYHLLSFACTAPSLPLTSDMLLDMLRAEFGELSGDWLSKRCWQGDKKYAFYIELSKLIDYIGGNPLEGPNILDAFRNDRDFYKHLNDADFEFQYPKLSNKSKEVIKPLMVSFYEKLLITGFPDYIHLVNKELFTYKLLLKGFYVANPRLKVCPGCDGPPPHINKQKWDIEVVDDDDEYQGEAEVDHFFPKALYPFLSIHFMNLVPLCPDCNLKAKKAQDPLHGRTGKGMLQCTFIPFCKPAVQCIEVTISKGVNHSPRVAIKNKLELASSEQAENLNKTFKLVPRWRQRLENWIGEAMLEVGRLQVRRKSNRQRIERKIKDKLIPLSKAQEDSIGQMSNLLIQRGYANYALNDQQEIELLIEQAMDDNFPKRR
jgi:hypothetical protein